MKLCVAIVLCVFSISATAQLSWYKCLSGKIDKYPVTLHLHKRSHQYTGYYYYNNIQEPVYFFGEDTMVTGKIKLQAVLPDRETEENFLFVLEDKTCTGSWVNPGGKTLDFSAEEITQTPSWD